MKRFLPLILLALVLPALAQTNTTYTVTQNSCGAKNLGFCSMPVVDQDNNMSTIVIDNRNNAQYLYLGAFSLDSTRYHGTLTLPTGQTRDSFYGTASFVSDDGTVTGNFTVYAFYQGSCSGRGCGGNIGWHYIVQSGSTVEVAK
jgi:hypothetical protein